MENAKEMIINIILEEGQVCVLTNKGRIFIQTAFNDKKGNKGWREIELPEFQES
jgi:hypothetical protein